MAKGNQNRFRNKKKKIFTKLKILMKELPLPKERRLLFSTQVNQETIKTLTESILNINENDAYLEKLYPVHDLIYKRKPIEIVIDSYGGSVYQCFGVISVMEKSITPIHTIVTGAAMSCGFMILISGHKRFAYKYSTPLYHQASSGAWGKLKELEEDIEETRRLQNIIEKITLEKTKISKKTLKEIFEKKKDWFMTSEEARRLGVVDAII